MGLAPWRVALASSIGTSHISAGLPCQDSAAHQFVEQDSGTVLISVVCDGAGSAAHSDVGSWLAANTFCELVALYLDSGDVQSINRDIVGRWIIETAESIEITARESGHPVRDYACTLLAVVISENCAAFIQVGDGAIVVSEGQEDGWSWVFWPQHGEFANTTNFIVSPGVLELFEFEISNSRIEEFSIFSDGIENLVLHQATKTVHSAFFDSMFPPVRSGSSGINSVLSEGLERYLSSPRICEKTDDDKTLILATRRPPVETEEVDDESGS